MEAAIIIIITATSTFTTCLAYVKLNSLITYYQHMKTKIATEWHEKITARKHSTFTAQVKLNGALKWG